MRYYFIDRENNEKVFDVNKTRELEGGVFEITVDNSTYYCKNVSGNLFISDDKKKWRKSAALNNVDVIVDADEKYKVYKGFKPSGLFSGGEGALVTQMPGKVVKIMINEGDEVKEGQPLLILEAMKMENEIKASVDGIIKSVLVKEGEALDSGHLMVEIE